jgi:hypothetical protein
MKLTKAQHLALAEVAANPLARAYGRGRKTVYKLVAMGLVEVLSQKDAGGHRWWAGWRVTEAGHAILRMAA